MSSMISSADVPDVGGDAPVEHTDISAMVGVPEEFMDQQADQELGLTVGEQDAALEATLFGEEPVEAAPEVQSESAEVTEASPGSGSPLGSTPSPQLDPNQQFMAQMFAQMQAQQQQQALAFQQALAALAPKKPEPEPEDLLGELPPEFNTPELKAYGKILLEKAAGRDKAFEQRLEKRIQESQYQKQVQQYQFEADSAAKQILDPSKYNLQGQDAREVSDYVRDSTLILAQVHGGSPSQYTGAVQKVLDKAVNGRIAAMNASAKAKVAQRQQPGALPRPQAGSPAISRNFQPPSDAEARAAGYKNAMDSGFDSDRRVLAMRARQSRG